MTAAPRDRLRFLIAERRGSRLAQAAAGAANQFLHQFHNQNERMDVNGEMWVMEVVAATNPKVVFDVGANVGQWSNLMARLVPPGTIHAFEPVRASAARLHEAMDGRAVIVNDFGLGSASGEIEFNIGAGETSVLASAVLEPEDFATLDGGDQVYRETCPVRRADEYCREAGIDRVDFAKIDVEGYEYEVLRGFGDLLADGRVRAVQFEYSDASLIARRFLADFADLFDKAGFQLGKLYLNRVDFSPYDVRQERWAGLNHIAVRRDWPELIRRLS